VSSDGTTVRLPVSCAGMRLYHASSPVQTKGPVSVENVTDVVRREVTASGVAEGIVVVSVPHTTCGMAVNEDEPGLRNDIRRLVERLLDPMAREAPFDHNCVDDNAQAHLTSLLLGHSVTLPVTGGAPGLGTWQSVFLIEMDGPRRRTLDVRVMGT
jgi:secondary thiamine-phosphate synthase enzyme